MDELNNRLTLINKLSCSESDIESAGRTMDRIITEGTTKFRDDEKETINKIISSIGLGLSVISMEVNGYPEDSKQEK